MAQMFRVSTTFTGTPVQGGGINRQYFLTTGGTAQQAATALGTFWNAIRPQMSTALTWTVLPTVETMEESTGTIVNVTSVAGSSFAGTDGGDPLPRSAQGLLFLNTSTYLNGRQLRGRINIPGATELSSTAGVPTAAYLNAFAGPANTLRDDATSAWCVWSKRNGTVLPVVNTSVFSKWAILKSRRD